MELIDLMRINESYKAARILQTAVELRVFDQLTQESLSADGVAQVLGLDARAAEMLLNALAALGLLHKTNGRYRNRLVAETYLVSDSPTFYGALILHTASGWDHWGQLANVIRNGEPLTPDRAYQDDPQATARFIRAMHGIAEAGGFPAMLADALAIDGIRTLLDVGGGPGSYSYEFCRRIPELRVTILDLPGTLAVTKEILAMYPDLARRVTLLPADFHTDPIPGKYDLILVSNIIHSHPQSENLALIQKLAAVTSSGGRIVVKDHILTDDGLSPAYGAIFSLQMLLHTRGRDYTFTEIRMWLEQAGYQQITHTLLPEITSASFVSGVKK